MRSPTRHARASEERRDEIGRDTHHGIHEARIHVHIRAHVLVRALFLQDDLRCQTLDRLQQIELRLIFGTFGKARREILADDGTRVGKRIDRVAHAR